MAVAYKLPCFFFGAAKAHSLNNIINPPFEELQQIFSGNAFHPFGLFKIAAELTLKNSIHPSDFLLLPQLQAVFRLFDAGLAVLAGRIAPAGDAAFIRITTLSLQKELHALSSAELTN